MNMKIKKNKDDFLKEYEKKQNKESKFFNDLILDPTFIERVKQFRKKHCIPYLGFKTIDKYQKWQAEYRQKLVEGLMIQETVTLDVDDKPESIKKEVKVRFNEYCLDIYKILKKYDFSLEWEPYVDHFICFNTPPNKMSVHEVFLTRHTFDGVIVEEELSFKVSATMNLKRHLTRKFMGKTVWDNAVKPLQKLMQGYKEKDKRPSRSKAALQARIARMHAQGKTDAEIANSPGIPEMNLSTVRKNISRFKKKIATNG